MSKNFLPRILILMLIPYVLLFGGSFNFALYPILQAIHLTMLGLGLGVWLVARTVGRWRWHPTALDGVIWLWIAAIIVSQLANPEMLRRGQPLIWFLTALFVGWYVLHDAMANGVITRAQIADMVLMATFVSMMFAIRQVFSPDSPNDGFFGLPRVTGLTENPNLFSPMLVIVIGLAVGRAWSMRGVGRPLMLTYAVVAVVLLGLTYSRGAWVGGALTVAVLTVMFAIDKGWMTREGARAAWQKAKSWQRAATIIFGIGAVLGAMAMGVILLKSLDVGGRSADLRTYLWLAAWDGFTEKPLTGNGLLTTPRIILDRSSVPPLSAQPHAHNFPLQVLSEMGILGGLAFLASIYIVVRQGIRAWRGATTKRERYIMMGGWAALFGYGVHHLFDLSAWTPYIAFCGLLTMQIMTAPPVNVPYPQRKERFAAWTVGILAVLVMVTGVYSLTQYTRYDSLLKASRQPGQMLSAAADFDALIASDPQQPVYRWSQAMLYAMRANATDDDALATLALDGFTEAGRLGMDSAVLRLNLAALNVQLGDLQAAQAHLERAAEYAPDGVMLLANVALAAERWGMDDTARDFWTRIFALPNLERSNLILMSGISDSAIAAEFVFPPPYQEAAAVPLLLDNRPDEALALLDAHPEWRTARAYALRSLANLALGQDPWPAIEDIKAVQSGGDWRWQTLAEWAASGYGVPLYAQTPDPSVLDYPDDSVSGNIFRLHFLRTTFVRLIVPQFGYDGREYPIAALVDNR